MSTTAKTGGSNGIFGALETALSGIGEGIAFAGREILPRFAFQELVDQKDDQLANPTFVFNPGQPSNTQFGSNGTPVATPEPRPTGLLFDNINVSGAGVAIAAATVLALVLVLRR